MAAPMDLPEGEVCRIWNRNAEWWDDRLGDGNPFQCELIEPATLRLLEPAPDQTILDIACGAGRMSRWMAARGTRVVAVDFCEAFLDRARSRSAPGVQIDYQHLDATDKNQLLALGAVRFHGAVATMALMDMARIDPLFEALPSLLRPGGRFVFSILHPCFFAPGTEMFAEERVVDGRSHRIMGLKVSQYRTSVTFRAEGVRGQPEPQLYFHRSLETILGIAFRNGFYLDGLEEPGFQTGTDRYFEWRGMPDLTPVLVCRLKVK